MVYRSRRNHLNRLYCWLIASLWLLSACIPRNVPLGPAEAINDGGLLNNVIQLEAARDGVFTIQGDLPEALPAPGRIVIEPPRAASVDDQGRALLRFGNILTLELLQETEIQIEQFTLDSETAVIDLVQNGGTIIADLAASPDVERRLVIQTPLATITAANAARFAIVHESDGSMAWVVGLAAREGDLLVTANEVTAPVAGGQARWVALAGEPGPVVSAGQNVDVWLNGARNNSPQLELSELLLAPANILADTGALTRLPAPGEPFEMGRDSQGGVRVVLDPQGIFSNPRYLLEDCNGDGVQDISVQNGILTMSFRDLLGRVEALDVTLFNRAEPGSGLLQVFGSAGNLIGQQQLQSGPETSETLSVRADQRFYEARLTLGKACFLGYSLTPPDGSGEPPAVRPVTGNLQNQSAAVVNVLANATARPAENGQLQAFPVGGLNLIQIDGLRTDWDSLVGQSGATWTNFSTVTYDDGCASRHPNGGSLTDLAGQVQLAYDEQHLYVAFVASDDGLVTYSGADERYFLGDSAQLLLDLNLNDDFDNAQLSGDDVQIDLPANVDGPLGALWQLGTLSSRSLIETQVAVSLTENGYFLEASLPWQELGVNPSPGERFGIVASLNDNDTPGADAQQCIISTSPQRDWRNPTTWGTLLLRPVGQ